MIRSLRPYPTYKDSSVPWLGQVPEHWEILPARSAYKPKLVKNVGMAEKTVLSLSYGRIIVKPEEKLHGLVPESFETYQIVKPGDIIVRTTDLQNDQTSLRVGLSRNRGIITSAYLCLRPLASMSSEYAYLVLNAYDLLKVLYGYGSGLRQNLDFTHIKRMPIVVPPLPEQSAIVHFLGHYDKLVRRYVRAKQKLIAGAQREGGLLHEYGARLTVDVVTGKLDVREAAANLPELSEETEELKEAESADGKFEDKEASSEADIAEVLA